MRALAARQERRPDLVLCDVVMPGMDGFDLCRAIRALPDGEHIPVVTMTGLEDLESIETAFAAGATEFSIKPLNWSLLPRHLRFILKASVTQEALRSSEERYALAARGANDGLWDWDLETGKTYYSPRWLELLGLTESPTANAAEGWLGRLHPEDEQLVREELAAPLDAGQERYESEHRLRHADGSWLWVHVRAAVLRDRRGRPTRMVGSIADISQRKNAIERLEYNALHDVLTGLPNRALFADRLDHRMRRCQRHPESAFAVMFIDLDRFKVVNDSLVHPAGDLLLIEVGQRLSDLLRRGETLARLEAVSRRWCAGTTRSAAACCPRPSSTWRARPA